jgi:DNA polymerase-3 subunit delta
MEVKTGQADRFVANPPKTLTAALVYGPDAGLVQERAEKLMKTVVADLTDPFNVADFNESVLLADNARLFDEAAAISMMGGRRVVRVRGAGNGLAELFERFLDDHVGDALVVVEAGDLAKSAALRKVFEGDDVAAAIACYPDSARDLPDVVRGDLKAQGLAIADDALDYAVSHLGSDRGVTRRELEKLAIYAHGQKQVSIADVHAVMGDEAEANTVVASGCRTRDCNPRLDRPFPEAVGVLRGARPKRVDGCRREAIADES